VLADIEVDGRPRQTLLTIGKPGVIWALDRRTGEFLWARETTHQTIYQRIDAETGQVALNESLIPTKLDENKFVCPSFYGGKLWMATAYNPASMTLFVPLNNLCMDYKTVEQQPLPGEDYGRGRMVFRHAPGNNRNIGRVDAVNLEDKQTLWSEQRRPYWSSFAARHCRRRRVRWRHQSPHCGIRGHNRENSLAVAAQQPARRFSHDLHGRRQAVCRDSNRTESDRQSGRAPVDAINSCAEPRLGAPGVYAA
jgi:hypothetical protein